MHSLRRCALTSATRMPRPLLSRPTALAGATHAAAPLAALPLRWSRALSTEKPAEGEAAPAEAAADATAEEAAAATETAEAAGAAETEDEAALLQARIAELEGELESKHDQVLRALAEADNARRRATIDVENAHKFAVGKFAKAMLDVADNLGRAAEAVPEEARDSDEQPTLKALYEGVVMTESVLLKAFEQHGLVRLWPMDEKFDPNMHNALFEMPDPEREPGTVAHVTKAGYVLHERCIRPADVGVVAKPA
jgi:molecular chaperone GrpE